MKMASGIASPSPNVPWLLSMTNGSQLKAMAV
jgi:hypothetical protein